MAKQDYYKILGVEKNADQSALKKAYRSLAMKYHPDRNPNDKAAEQKFKELNEAYDVLKDEQKRAAYDQFGHSAFENGGFGASGFGGGRGGFGGGFAGGNFSDVFEEMFGEFMGGGRGGFGGGFGGRASGASAGQGRGADLTQHLEITLEEAFNGAEKKINITKHEACSECHGSGAAKGSSPKTCTDCNGVGRVRMQQGFFTIERTCPTCGGAGEVIKDPCKKCQGSGRERSDKTLAVSVPAGLEDGTRIRLSGEGEAGVRGGRAGDLYVFINIKPHKFFKREGSDLHCRAPIPITTAALGGAIEVPNIEGGRTKFTIPSGTQSGQKFRLKGKGMTQYGRKDRGDMFLEVSVETPVNLSSKQKDILKELEKTSGEKNNPRSSGFFSKVKELWEDLRD